MAYSYSTDSVAYSAKTFTFSANIVSYNAATKIATLDRKIDVSLGYNSGIKDLTSQYSISGMSNNISSAISAGNSPPSFSTDETGKFIGIFNVPNGIFHVGQRVFRVDNRIIPSQPETATSYAEAIFYSTGLSGKVSQTEYSASFDPTSSHFFQSSEAPRVINVYTPHDPIAQTFTIGKDNFPNGVFISSIKLFFATKPTQSIPITLSVVGTNNGIPGGKILDYSTVTLDSSQVVTSSAPHYLDSTTYTEFVFDAPVYLKPDVLYAILLQSNSADYNVYVARQNENAVLSTSKANPTDTNPTVPSKIGTIPFLGNLFESQNSQTWVPLQTTDLMFVIDRCIFNTTPIKTNIPFQVPTNLVTRKLAGLEVQYKLDSNSINSVYDTFALPVEVDEFNVTTTDFLPPTTEIYYSYQSLYGNLSSPQQSAIKYITPGKYGLPTPTNIDLGDGNGPRIIHPRRNDSFIMYADMSSRDSTVSPVISDDGTTIYSMKYFINDMGISNNIITVVNGGSGYNAYTTSATISASDYGVAPTLSVTIANGSITQVSVSQDSDGSGYIKTPTITIQDANSSPGTGAVVTVAGETSASGGNALCRYYTKPVTLTPQNDSGDLRVFLTAYWPYKSNILVYYKILNRNDSTKFDDRNWQLMTLVNNVNTYSAIKNEVIEYEFAPGTYNQADNFVSYTSSGGTVYDSFSQFAIKIVMATDDNTIVPYITDMRTLALPPGTGI
jgi:hypothetical protein